MSRRSLDRASVVHEAALLADRDGFESLTLSVLAARLGVKPPSLYNHIESLDALRRSLQIEALRVFTACSGEAAMGHSGRAALERMARALFTLARKRPGVWTAMQRAPAPGDAELQESAREALKPFDAVLKPMGLSKAESVHLLRALRALIQGFASLEAMGGFGLPEAVEESFTRALARILPK
jgi:AcrR family transcriptional regulator